ncbi:Aste57867_13998 [Aphanomyces stellatus]|uniref:Aste57867_13998 protein n=1 Tax=Aphanomyces stellatus TaxID=120398 RepID=A0A485L1T3_9STRA|nr:hypothetical protein As57867_013947 [Aphanomyces stellatus]VFT90828.1 Aste57867_13998 [Aphanomyces stellatus]
MSNASTVLGTIDLVCFICAHQDGLPGDVAAVQRCQIIQGIHGRLIRCPNGIFSQHEWPALTGQHVDMDDLPATMQHRQSLVEAVLQHPTNSVVLSTLLAKQVHIRDVVVEYAVFFGCLDLVKSICTTMKRNLLSDSSEEAQFDALNRLRIPSNALQLRQLAVFHGHLDVLMYLNTTSYSSLHGRCGTELSYSDIEVAAERRHLRCVEYLVAGALQLHAPSLTDGTIALGGDYFGFRPPSNTTTINLAKQGLGRVDAAEAAKTDGLDDMVRCLTRAKLVSGWRDNDAVGLNDDSERVPPAPTDLARPGTVAYLRQGGWRFDQSVQTTVSATAIHSQANRNVTQRQGRWSQWWHALVSYFE